MQKILLTAIIKDDSEVELFERMLKSFMPHVDGLCVAITGLSAPDGTKKIARLIRDYGGEYIITTPATHPDIYLEQDGKSYFANFAAARNACFELARKMQEKSKYDWWTWADTDDLIKGGKDLKLIAESAKHLDWVQFTYWYSVKEVKGKITDIVVEHNRERLLSPRIEWKWISRLHEVCVPADQNYEPKGAAIVFNPQEDGMQTVWVHMPPEGHFEPNLERNVRILEVQVKEEQHKDPRTLFYLAKCYIDLEERNHDKTLLITSKTLLEEYRKLSGWAEERSFACQYLGMIALKQKNLQEAKAWYHKAIEEHPISHLSYLWLAHIYMELNMTEESDHWLDVATELPPPVARASIGSPMEIKLLWTKLKYNQAMKKQDIPLAIKFKQRWNELEGKEEDEVLDELKTLKESNDAATWLHNYAIYLKKKGYKEQARQLMSALAPEFRNEQFAQILAHEVMEPKVWGESIVYLAASQFAPFNPKTAMQDGIGGSETAVMRLSVEWAKNGHKVTVFANCDDCEVDGVTYKHWNQFNANDTFDKLIIWRNPGFLDQPLKAKKIFVDAHDILSNLDFTKERVAKMDMLFVKSKYHRKQVPSVPDNKVIILSNGVDI